MGRCTLGVAPNHLSVLFVGRLEGERLNFREADGVPPAVAGGGAREPKG